MQKRQDTIIDPDIKIIQTEEVPEVNELAHGASEKLVSILQKRRERIGFQPVKGEKLNFKFYINNVIFS